MSDSLTEAMYAAQERREYEQRCLEDLHRYGLGTLPNDTVLVVQHKAYVFGDDGPKRTQVLVGMNGRCVYQEIGQGVDTYARLLRAVGLKVRVVRVDE